jgi:hypothetical protein
MSVKLKLGKIVNSMEFSIFSYVISVFCDLCHSESDLKLIK